jgi:uncharacterized membrane protein YeaQ/YmgE (transglycosylase-associated protein family)
MEDTMEDLVQMGPMLLLAGCIAGWLAETTSRAGGYGLIPDMIVGIAGSLGGGAIMWTFISSDAGMLGMALVGGAAGGLAIATQRAVWRSAA